MENKTIYLTAQDVSEALNISQSMAYKLIREWKKKQKEKGKIVKTCDRPKPPLGNEDHSTATAPRMPHRAHEKGQQV